MELESKRLRPTRMTETAQATADLVLGRVCPPVALLEHAAHSVRGFLDFSRNWTLETASKTGLVRLLDRLASQEWPGLSLVFREARYLYNVRVAARTGYIDVLNWWTTKYLPNGPDVRTSILYSAAFKGHLHVIQWLFEQEEDHAQSIIDQMQVPLICSLPDIVRWMHEHHRQVKMHVGLEEAAARGDLELIVWVQEQGYRVVIDAETIEAAATNGHLSVVQYLRNRLPVFCHHGALAKAAQHGHFNVVQWLLEDGYLDELLYYGDICALLASEHSHIIKWIVENYRWGREKEQWVLRTMKAAAGCGNMDILQYLYAHHKPKDLRELLQYGVCSGKLEIVQWIYARGITTTEEIMWTAVNTGKLEMVRWVHTHCDCRHTSVHEMDCAAARSRLDVVQWLHANRSGGCTAKAMNHAATSGLLDMVKWLQENRSEGVPAQAIVEAATFGHLEVVEYLFDHCTQANAIPAMEAAATQGHLNVVQWLHEHGVRNREVMDSAYKAAIESGEADVVAYIALHCGARCPAFDVGKIARDNRYHLLAWLLQYSPDPVPTADGQLENVRLMFVDFQSSAVGIEAD